MKTSRRAGLYRSSPSAVMLAFLLVAGCGPKEEADSNPPPTAAKEKAAVSFKAALLSPGPIDDAGWNALAYEGLQKVKAELGAEVGQQQVKPADFEEAFRNFAGRGFNIIYAHGFEFGKMAQKLAPDFPKTSFVITACNVKNEKNLASIDTQLEQPSYLLGLIAGAMTKTNKIGAVGGIEFPVLQSAFDAYEQGAKSVNQKIRVVRSWVGGWEDQNKAKELTVAQIAQGCDFIYHNADHAGLGVFRAVKEKSTLGKDQHVYAFGSNRNQNSIPGYDDIVLASAVLEIPRVFADLAKEVRDHKFKGRIISMTMKDDYVSLQINPQLKCAIPKATLDKIEETTQKMRAGELKIAHKT